MSESTLSAEARAFIAGVTESRPRIAVFDCDGTLWEGDSGSGFMYWEIEQGILPAQKAEWMLDRYRQYKKGSVDEYTICAEMVTVHNGLPVSTIREAAKHYLDGYLPSHIFSEMKELTETLAAQGAELWAVSSTCNWVVEEGAGRFGIPASRVLAAAVMTDPSGTASGSILRVPTDEFKASVIQEVLAKPVDAAFGNSIHDFAMLQLANTPWVIAPTKALEAKALALGWRIYIPGLLCQVTEEQM